MDNPYLSRWLERVEGKVDALVSQGANHEPRIQQLEQDSAELDRRVDDHSRSLWRMSGAIGVIALAAPFAVNYYLH